MRPTLGSRPPRALPRSCAIHAVRSRSGRLLRHAPESTATLRAMAAAPRNQVSAEGLAKRYAGRAVLDGVSLGIAAGDRIGVVGPNGGGKSTLVRLLARRAEPDAGSVVHAGGLTVGLLTQDDELHGERTIRDVVIRGRADHEWAGDRRI